MTTVGTITCRLGGLTCFGFRRNVPESPKFRNRVRLADIPIEKRMDFLRKMSLTQPCAPTASGTPFLSWGVPAAPTPTSISIPCGTSAIPVGAADPKTWEDRHLVRQHPVRWRMPPAIGDTEFRRQVKDRFTRWHSLKKVGNDSAYQEAPSVTQNADGADTLLLTQQVTQSLARSLFNRAHDSNHGDLQLDRIEPAITGHPQASLIWEVALRFIYETPSLRGRMRTVTDARVNRDKSIHVVKLPAAARALLRIPPRERGRDGKENRDEWILGQRVYPAFWAEESKPQSFPPGDHPVGPRPRIEDVLHDPATDQWTEDYDDLVVDFLKLNAGS